MMGMVEAPRAWWLLHGMARTAGVDLARAVVDGWMTRGEVARLVQHCATCGQVAECAEWQAERLHDQPAAFCTLGPALDELAPGNPV